MARISPTRPKYWRKHNPVVYVVKERMYVRARAERIRNPRTKAQQDNRHKLSVASRFLAQMQPMVALGFRATRTCRQGWETRGVGAYHVALGLLLKSGMRKEKKGWRIEYQHVKLSEGNCLEGFPMEVRRSGREMSISLPHGLPKGTRRVRMAIHSPRKGRTAHVAFDAPKRGEVLRVGIPKWAANGALHVYYTVDVKGKSRWASRYIYVARGRGPSGRGRIYAAVGRLPLAPSTPSRTSRGEGRAESRGMTTRSGSSPPAGVKASGGEGLPRKEYLCCVYSEKA